MAEFKMYPRMLYHETYPETRKVIVVQSMDEQNMLGRGWYDTPTLHQEVNAPPKAIPEAPPSEEPCSDSPSPEFAETPISEITTASEMVDQPVTEDPELAAFLGESASRAKGSRKKR